MSMFDQYLPVPALQCPVCAMPLSGWQSKDGPCLLLVWQQGSAAPVGQRVAEESRLPATELAELRLPDEFHVYTDGCDCGRTISAVGRCVAGVWSHVELITPANARPATDESDHEFRARLRELERWYARADRST